MNGPRDVAFYMVFCQGRDAPKRMHETQDSARREAERLARSNPGEVFYVLRAMEFRQVNDMSRGQLDEPLPF